MSYSKSLYQVTYAKKAQKLLIVAGLLEIISGSIVLSLVAGKCGLDPHIEAFHMAAGWIVFCGAFGLIFSFKPCLASSAGWTRTLIFFQFSLVLGLILNIAAMILPPCGAELHHHGRICQPKSVTDQNETRTRICTSSASAETVWWTFIGALSLSGVQVLITILHVMLWVQRASAVRTEVQENVPLNPANQQAVARLNGVPLTVQSRSAVTEAPASESAFSRNGSSVVEVEETNGRPSSWTIPNWCPSVARSDMALPLYAEVMDEQLGSSSSRCTLREEFACDRDQRSSSKSNEGKTAGNLPPSYDEVAGKAGVSQRPF